MAASTIPSVVGAARDGQELSCNSGYRNSKNDISLSDIAASSAFDVLETALISPSACKWEELPWLKAQSSFSLAAVTATKPELSLRPSGFHSHGKNRSSRMNPMAISHEMHTNGRDLAGIASNGFWRRKACADWWSRVNETNRAEAFKLAVAKVAKSEEDAGHLFDKTPLRDFLSIRGLYSVLAQMEDADDMFDKTPMRDFIPNRGSFSVSALTKSAEQDFGSQQKTELSKPFQILIAHISGKSMLHWVRPSDLVQELKLLMEKKTGIPTMYQRLLYEGKQLEDTCPLSSYNIQRNASITLSMRLRGGAAGQSSSAAAFSYKDAVHSKKSKERASPASAPKPFVVDKSEDIPSIELAHPMLDKQYQLYAENGIICRFNGLWPSTADLYQWIQANWTNNCKVYFCSKGFFIVVFVDSDDYQRVLTKGPWFWNSAGLFLTPWFPEFDPSTAVITKLPIWVRLPNLPVHLWNFMVFEAIGNTLGRFLETDPSRGQKGIYTYARICAEIDISKGLPDQIILKIGDFHWTQPLDYENTAFRCRYCHLTGHLQSSCPSMPFQKKKAKSKPKDKSWKPHDPPPMDEFSSSDEEDVDEDVEVVEEKTEHVSPSVRHEEATVPPIAQKRHHESSPSDSDKELSPPVQNSLQIVFDPQGPTDWVKVGKKKGKKSRPSVSTLGG